MKAIILAAGRGSRMKELTDERPKCLVEFEGRPLLDWQLSALREGGVSEIGIVTGYRRELIAGRGTREFHNARWAETNMVTSLEAAVDWLRSDTCIVSYSDIFYSPQAVRLLRDDHADVAVTYDPDWRELWSRRFEDPLLDAETFRLGADGCLIDIGGRPSTVEEVQGQYMGLLRFTPAGWAAVERLRAGFTAPEQDRMHMTGMLQHLISRGAQRVFGIAYSGRWGEIDSASDLAAYR